MAYYNGKKVLSLVAGGTGGGSGIEYINITDFETLPEEHRNLEKLKKSYLIDDHNYIFKPSYIESDNSGNFEIYYENTDGKIYRYLYIYSETWEIHREEPEELASSTNIVDVTSWIEAGKVPEEYRDIELLKNSWFSYNGGLFTGIGASKQCINAQLLNNDQVMRIGTQTIVILTESYYGSSQWNITYNSQEIIGLTTTGVEKQLNNKQDKLTAGEGITIAEDGTISATGGVTEEQVNDLIATYMSDNYENGNTGSY